MNGPSGIPDWWQLMQQWAQQLLHASTLAFVGLVVGIGKLLQSREILHWRVVVGRALTAGALGMAAGTVLAWWPDLPWVAQAGMAAALASLGTSGLERVFSRVVGGKQ